MNTIQWGPLFHQDPKTKRVRKWQVSAAYTGYNVITTRTIHGFIDGKLSEKDTKIVPVAGKTLEEKVVIDVRQRYVKKMRDGYMPEWYALGPGNRSVGMADQTVEDLEKLGFPPDTRKKKDALSHKSPFALAAHWSRPHPVMRPVYNDPHDQSKYVMMPCMPPIDPQTNQIKLDGDRCMVNLQPPLRTNTELVEAVGNSGERVVVFHTRSAGEYYAPHLGDTMISLLTRVYKILRLNPQEQLETYLDMELFSCVTSPQIVNGLLKRTKTTQKVDPAMYMTIQSYIYDIYSPRIAKWSYLQRHALLRRVYIEMMREELIVNTYILGYVISRSVAEIEYWLEEFVKKGYEGLMVRHVRGPASTYKPGRSTHLLKFKPFIDDDGLVIELKDCEGTEEGACRLIILTRTGKTFRCRPNGTLDVRRAYMQNPQAILYKIVKYRYQRLTDDGIPFHPRAMLTDGLREVDFNRYPEFRHLFQRQ